MEREKVTHSPLLEEHGDGSQQHPAEHRLGFEEGPSGHELQLDRRPCRAVCKMREVFGRCALLEHRLRFDLQKLEFD